MSPRDTSDVAGAGRLTSSTARGETQSRTAVTITNARTRLVGNRTGFLADIVVAVVRWSRSVGQLLARLAARITAVVTPLGWTILALVPAALIIGYSAGWLELVVVGWAGLVLLAVAAIYLVGRSRIELTLRMAHARVVVGDIATAEVIATNPLDRRILGSVIEVPVGQGLVAVTMPSLRRRGEFRHLFGVPTARRGRVTVGPVRTIRADPVGLIRRELVWTQAAELFVHPRTIAIPSTSTGFVRDLEGNPTRDLSSSDVSFHALREYVSGDDRRYIHWKSTAKTGTYMVRQFEETRRSHLVVALSLAEADYASDEEFELAVSVTGSLAARAIRDTRSVSVVVSESTPEFAKRTVYAIRPLATVTRARLLDDLAVVERAATALPMTEVARVAAEQVAGISVAFLVCGSAVSASQLRGSTSAFPVGVEVIAIVCDPDAVPGLRRVAGLSVFTIGYLEDLQRALARMAAA